MKLKITQTHLQNLTKIGLFLCVIAIIVQLFPTKNKFKYQFEIGKPWSYELVTASFDFPIYKSEQQIAIEREEILRNFTPYFKLDTTVQDVEINRFFTDWQKKSGHLPRFHKKIVDKYKSIYTNGIISVDEYNKLFEDSTKNISIILPNRMTRSMGIEELYTPKTAYEEIIRDAPEIYKSYNLDLYLVENLSYDSVTSQLSKADLLKSLSLTSGMIQTGERIIDRGEIVSHNTFWVLQSLKIEYEKRKESFQQSSIVIVGEIIMIFGLILLFFLYIYLFRPRIYDSFGNLIFMSMLILLMVGLTSITIRYTSLSYYMVPFALLPIIIRVFFDARTALFAHIISVLIISFMVDNPFQFIVIQIAIGMAAVSSLKDMTQRSQLAQTALYIFVCYVFMHVAFEFITEGDIDRIHWQPIIYFAISSGFLLFAYVLIYLFEKLFGLISAVTLL